MKPGPLLILALDTTTRAGSVAVARGDAVLAEMSGDPSRTHGQRLPGDLMLALEQAGARLEDVDLLAVAAGPGSFTGLRVGIATMQGLAFSRGLQIVCVPVFEALACHAIRSGNETSRVAPWIDAQRGEVFAMLYGPGLASVEVPASAAPPEDTLERWRSAIGSGRVTFTGDGALRYRDRIRAALGEQTSILEPVPLLAGEIARIAARNPARAVVPHAVVPVYVRRSDAELARERTGAR